MRSLGRGFLFGCGGILALGVLVIVIIAVIAAGMSGSTGGGGAPAEGATETLIVRVTGTEGIPFSGNYGGIEGSQTVDGTVPTDYEIQFDTSVTSMDTLAAVMQKTGAEGSLTVQIVRDGEILAERTTTAEYGAVDVSWTPGT